MESKLEELIPMLAKARQDLVKSADLRKKAIELFERTPDFIALEYQLNADATLVDEIEGTIRTLAIEEGTIKKGTLLIIANKNPHEAVTLKSFTVVGFPENTANLKAWCLKNYTAGLTLDKTKVKDAAKIGVIPNSLAPVTEEPRAQIDTDLSKYL